MSKQKRAYKYRFDPTDEQKRILAQTFGCCRFVYNWGLHTRKAAYAVGQKLTYNDLSAMLPDLKKIYPWLGDVSSVPIQQSLRHLDKGFKNFFEGRSKYPTFKKRQGNQSATYASNAFTWGGQTLTLAKMGEPLAIHLHRDLPCGVKPSSVTVSKDCANRYFVSILVEEDIKPLPVVNKQVGLDLGIKSMVILSTGEAVGNPRYYAKDEKRLAKAQRRHAKKKKGSQNREKARRKVAHVHARIADRRRDYQHKLSTCIVNENQVICVESLAVKNMVKNHCLAKAVSDVGWGEFVRQLEYKSQWSGRTLIKIDRWYPSSKTCHDCKHVVEELPLDVREWVCPECGVWHDRDINAAINILAEGLSASACGGGVRPAAVRKGNPQRSRKAHS
ncbi:MAG TPA: RNA-guided endonuclease TnpB family protein [Ktedonobacteraceae bacterium]|nr:RNA-guided endonuclease TnpB family protein [Ktedonobacteraceae bacterium]